MGDLKFMFSLFYYPCFNFLYWNYPSPIPFLFDKIFLVAN